MQSRREARLEDFMAALEEALKRVPIADITVTSPLAKRVLEFLGIAGELSRAEQQPVNITAVNNETVSQMQVHLNRQHLLRERKRNAMSEIFLEADIIFSEAVVAHITGKTAKQSKTRA